MSILLLVLEMVQSDKDRKSHFDLFLHFSIAQWLQKKKSIRENICRWFDLQRQALPQACRVLSLFCEAGKAVHHQQQTYSLPKFRGFFRVP